MERSATWRTGFAIGALTVAALAAHSARAQTSSSPPPSSSSPRPSSTVSSAAVSSSSSPSSSSGPTDDVCPAGGVPIDRERHCCEPGQRFVAGHCEGAPSVCPPGTQRERTATTCAPVPCTDGRVRASDNAHCCWPGQHFGREGGRDAGHTAAHDDDDDEVTVCAGRVATCPDGTTRLASDDCAPAAGPASAPPRASIPRGAAWVPGGTYRAGSGDRVITVAPFAMDRTEVTVAQYAECVRAGRCDAARDAFAPVTAPRMPRAYVTHAMARSYCGFAGGRLPTEAEWELAARGFDRRVFPWGDRRPDCTLARMAGCGDGPAPVESLRGGASPFGVLDLAGNLAEWVSDRGGPLDTGSEWNPTGPREGDARVVRGGSFADGENALRGSARRSVDAREGRYDVGFRCVY